MSKNKNFKKERVPSKNSQDVAFLFKKMQYKLDSMEEKIDYLIQQLKEKSAKGGHSSRTHKERTTAKYPRERKYEGKKEEVRFRWH